MANISIYRRSYDGKIVLVGFGDHIDDLLKTCDRISIRSFGYTFNDRIEGYIRFNWDKDYRDSVLFDYRRNYHFAYLVFDARDKLITPDRLVGLYRAYVRKHDRGRWYYYRGHPGHKQKNGHYYRRYKVHHERTWCTAWDDEDFAPKIRAARNSRNLPHRWINEIPRHLSTRNNNWKRYRNSQWKDKKGDNK